jgi:hypothetical protein
MRFLCELPLSHDSVEVLSNCLQQLPKYSLVQGRYTELYTSSSQIPLVISSLFDVRPSYVKKRSLVRSAIFTDVTLLLLSWGGDRFRVYAHFNTLSRRKHDAALCVNPVLILISVFTPKYESRTTLRFDQNSRM